MFVWEGVFTFPKIVWEKYSCFFNIIYFFFLNVFSYQGNDLNFHFSNNRLKVELVDRKLTQKLTLFTRLTLGFGHFGGRTGRFLDFFKVFLELFRKCLGIIFDFETPTFGFSFISKG